MRSLLGWGSWRIPGPIAGDHSSTQSEDTSSGGGRQRSSSGTVTLMAICTAQRIVNIVNSPTATSNASLDWLSAGQMDAPGPIRSYS